VECKKENEELESALKIKSHVIESLTSQLNKARVLSTLAVPKPIDEPTNMFNKSLLSNEPSFFVSEPAMTSTPSKFNNGFAVHPKRSSASKGKEFEYDYKNR
jgi:hypothetical protein